MKKTHLVSALGLAMILASAGVSQGLALETGTLNDNTVILGEVARSAELEKVMNDARIAREIARQNPSETYPGLVKYIDGLLAIAESGNIQNEAELIAALDDAAFATPLLLGVKVVQTSGEMVKSAETPVMQALVEVNESPVVDNNIVLANANLVVADSQLADIETETENSEGGLDDATYDDEVSGGEDMAEVPHTGEDAEERRTGMGELMIAGVVVVLATVGGAIFVVRNRKNN